MSNRYITAAMECRVGSMAKKLILIKLADNANDDGLCWPSYATIARHCECDKRTVMRHIKDMVDMGVLTRKHRITNSGNTSNYFQLTIPLADLTRGDKLSLGGDTGSPGGCHVVTRGVTEDHPEPSLEPSIKPEEESQNEKTSFDEQIVVQEWNVFAKQKGIPCIRQLSDNYTKKLREGYKVYAKFQRKAKSEVLDIDEFVKAYVEYLQDLTTPHHLGENSSSWKMTFDYAFSKTVVENVLNSGVLKR